MANANPYQQYILSKPATGHTTSYNQYLSNTDLREWVQRRLADCQGKFTEKEYVRWAIKEYRTLEDAKAAIMPIDVDDASIKEVMKKAIVIGGKPTSNNNSVKYFRLNKDLGIRVWLDDPEDPINEGCSFDFIDGKLVDGRHVEVPKPAILKVHALDGPKPGSEIYPIKEHIKQAGMIGPNATHPTWSTYLLPCGTTLRFRWEVKPPVTDVIVRLPMFLKGEDGRAAPIILH